MSIVFHTEDVVVNYPWEQVFNAMEKTIPCIKGMKIETANKFTRTITIKCGGSLFSQDENLTCVLTPMVDSNLKTGIRFDGTMDMGKNKKNINAILNKMTSHLYDVLFQ